MSFAIRTTKPSNNKFYITTDKGGYSQCVKGSPTDPKANVLSNCVGYACGRFNEVIGEMKYPKFYTNAENFIEVAKNYGLEISMTPVKGSILVMQKGNTLSGKDGAGHVIFIEEVYDNNHVYTSESAYGGTAFYNVHRYNTNGRWGMGSGYSFRGFIINPYIKVEEKKELSLVYKVGDKVKINGVYRRSDSDEKLHPLKYTGTITALLPGKKNPYLLDDGNLGWVNKDCIVSKVTSEIKVGDKVLISNPYDEKGRRLYVNGIYDVIEVSGERVVVGKGTVVTAAIDKDNLTKL